MAKRSKEWGYELEKLFERELRAGVFPKLRRRGSIGYYADAPDLTQEVEDAPRINIVATKDKGRNVPPLVTVSVEDLKTILRTRGDLLDVRVQVKGRAQTWIGGLYEKLRRAA